MVVSEKLDIHIDTIEQIQNMYNSDIRSMINFIQLHQNYDCMQSNIITNDIWNNMKDIIDTSSTQEFHMYIHQLSIHYNIDKKTIIKDYYNYIVRNYPDKITIPYLTNIEVILHTTDMDCSNMLNYMKHV